MIMASHFLKFLILKSNKLALNFLSSEAVSASATSEPLKWKLDLTQTTRSYGVCIPDDDDPEIRALCDHTVSVKSQTAGGKTVKSIGNEAVLDRHLNSDNSESLSLNRKTMWCNRALSKDIPRLSFKIDDSQSSSGKNAMICLSKIVIIRGEHFGVFDWNLKSLHEVKDPNKAPIILTGKSPFRKNEEFHTGVISASETSDNVHSSNSSTSESTTSASTALENDNSVTVASNDTFTEVSNKSNTSNTSETVSGNILNDTSSLRELGTSDTEKANDLKSAERRVDIGYFSSPICVKHVLIEFLNMETRLHGVHKKRNLNLACVAGIEFHGVEYILNDVVIANENQTQTVKYCDQNEDTNYADLGWMREKKNQLAMLIDQNKDFTEAYVNAHRSENNVNSDGKYCSWSWPDDEPVQDKFWNSDPARKGNSAWTGKYMDFNYNSDGINNAGTNTTNSSYPLIINAKGCGISEYSKCTTVYKKEPSLEHNNIVYLSDNVCPDYNLTSSTEDIYGNSHRRPNRKVSQALCERSFGWVDFTPCCYHILERNYCKLFGKKIRVVLDGCFDVEFQLDENGTVKLDTVNDDLISDSGGNDASSNSSSIFEELREEGFIFGYNQDYETEINVKQENAFKDWRKEFQDDVLLFHRVKKEVTSSNEGSNFFDFTSLSCKRINMKMNHKDENRFSKCRRKSQDETNSSATSNESSNNESNHSLDVISETTTTVPSKFPHWETRDIKIYYMGEFPHIRSSSSDKGDFSTYIDEEKALECLNVMDNFVEYGTGDTDRERYSAENKCVNFIAETTRVPPQKLVPTQSYNTQGSESADAETKSALENPETTAAPSDDLQREDENLNEDGNSVTMILIVAGITFTLVGLYLIYGEIINRRAELLEKALEYEENKLNQEDVVGAKYWKDYNYSKGGKGGGYHDYYSSGKGFTLRDYPTDAKGTGYSHGGSYNQNWPSAMPDSMTSSNNVMSMMGKGSPSASVSRMNYHNFRTAPGRVGEYLGGPSHFGEESNESWNTAPSIYANNGGKYHKKSRKKTRSGN